MVFLSLDRVFWAIVRENWFTGVGCSSVVEYKNQIKVTGPVGLYVAPRGVTTAHRIQIKLGRDGNLPNVITHANCQIDCNKIVTSAKGWSFMFSHHYGGRYGGRH